MALSFTSISANGRHSLTGTNSGFTSEIENEDEEVDQLDSGLDEEDEMEPEVGEEESSSMAKGRRKLGARISGHTLVPQDRLDNILQAEGSGPHMSKEAVYMLSIATEEFVKKLAESGFQQTVSENRQHVQYRDMANATRKRPEFKFLNDTIPKPISISDAMQLRATKERELVEGDPAISSAIPSSPPFLPTQPNSVAVSISTKGRVKSRQSLPAQTNGRETNGRESASASVSVGTPTAVNTAPPRARHRDSRGRWRNGPSANGSHEGSPSSTASGTRAGSARIRYRSARAREAVEITQPYASHSNGNTPIQNAQSASSASTQHEPAVSIAQQGRWTPGQAIGPASGYLDDGHRTGLTGRNTMTDNPGRTIYSQQFISAQDLPVQLH